MENDNTNDRAAVQSTGRRRVLKAGGVSGHPAQSVCANAPGGAADSATAAARLPR